MTGVEILVGVAGVIVTALVVAGMILLTPRGVVELREDAAGDHRPADARERVTV